VTLTNQGTASSPEGIVHKISVGVSETGHLFWSDSFASSLVPGESVVLVVNAGSSGDCWTLQEGKHTIVASVDGDDIVEELDETNNTAMRIIGL
jgi:subtilase family serine protease